jgi:GNAT superfamily N-acetyltransferase
MAKKTRRRSSTNASLPAPPSRPEGADVPAGAIGARPLEPTDWPVMEELFGETGACGGCWCMLWRVEKGGRSWEERKGETNRQAFRTLVEAGQAQGVLAFAGDRPVGWCSIGPARSFPRMLKSRVLDRPRTESTWSVTCFFIAKDWRGRGVSVRLLEAAVQLAASHGATEIEGFPVASGPDAKRRPGPFVWTGVPAIFRAAGFEETPDPPGTRPIYLKVLPARGRGARGATLRSPRRGE